MIKKLVFKFVGAVLNLTSLFRPKLAIRWTIALFSTPRRAPLRKKERDFVATARQNRFAVGDLPLVEYQWGSTDPKAPLALLVYGWEYNAGRWRHFVPGLVQAGFRVVAFDPPGHGLAPDGQMNIPRNALIIKALIEKHGRPEVIIAHSFGGSSSVFALHDLPEWQRPKRMVVMASFSFVPRIFRDFGNLLGMREPLYYGIVRSFEERVGRRLEEFDFARMSSDFEQIKGLLVHAPEDPVTPFAEARRYFDFWNGAALFAPPGGGHHLGKPNITDAILDFAIGGEVPEGADIQAFALPGKHDLARHFAGM